MIHFDNLGWTMIHVYKTGGCGIHATLKAAGLEPEHDLHRTAHECSKKVWWGASFNFALIRMPYDWIVSQWFFLRQHEHHFFHEAAMSMSFEEFVDRYPREYPERRKVQGHFVRMGECLGSPVVPGLRLYRYDEIDIWWDAALEALGQEGDDVPMIQANISKDRTHWADLVTREIRMMMDSMAEYAGDWDLYENAKGEEA